MIEEMDNGTPELPEDQRSTQVRPPEVGPAPKLAEVTESGEAPNAASMTGLDSQGETLMAVLTASSSLDPHPSSLDPHPSSLDPHPPASRLDAAAGALARGMFTGAAILFLVGAGFRAGIYFRRSHPGAPVPPAATAVLSGVHHLRGNVSRMIAFQSSGGDDHLGMEGEAFADTLDVYWRSVNTIVKDFYNPTPLSSFTATGQAILADSHRLRTQLTYSAIQGVMSSLNDPYTRFMDPTAYKEMQQDNAGSFAGIGAQLIDKDGKIVIVKALPDTPAAAVHLMPMDQIIKINGKSTEQMTSENAVQLIRGKAGTPVLLTLRRGGKLLNVRIIRAMITQQHFDYRVIDGDIGYMHLMMFDELAADNIQHSIQYFSHQGVKGLILDLRDDPGGLLNSAVDVSSLFIPPGTVVWVQERGGQRNSLTTNGDSHSGHHLPLVVLVNHYSASASEIVSGAIKDTHSGTLMGLATWGKGLVQEVIPLNDNSALALTTAHYFTPSGSDINLKGVAPDVVEGHTIAEPDSDDPAVLNKLLQEKDAVDNQQLDAAVALVHRRIGDPASAPHARSASVAPKPIRRPPLPL